MLTAINALGVNQREYAERVNTVGSALSHVDATLADTNALVRSLEDGQAEIRDLLIRALDR
ncbi:MAG TPA: hypothetical protein PKK01_11480 [Mycobacterium sp.]|nr:hypothetical protein [Mycobacterium sp.]